MVMVVLEMFEARGEAAAAIEKREIKKSMLTGCLFLVVERERKRKKKKRRRNREKKTYEDTKCHLQNNQNCTYRHRNQEY